MKRRRTYNLNEINHPPDTVSISKSNAQDNVKAHMYINVRSMTDQHVCKRFMFLQIQQAEAHILQNPYPTLSSYITQLFHDKHTYML